MKTLIIILISIFLPTFIWAQELINLKRKTVYNTQDSILLDSLSVVSQSIKFLDYNGKTVEQTIDYRFDFESSILYFNNKMPFDSLIIEFKTFPINFYEPYYIFKKSDFLVGEKNVGTEYDMIFSREDYKAYGFNQSQLARKGSISRGISFGNNQDVIVNSSLNLQLDGKLNDELYISAAISDNNIPIQPDGTSQQLQEFDKVYIKLYNDKISLIAGDFDLRKPEGYFINYYKKAQGASVSLLSKQDNRKGKEIKIENNISGAIAKGKFRRQEIKGVEGNQGPYKLTGANNETYIIILAGTEKVYIDGILLTRGTDNDYVMDYNLGEISFTPRQPINKDKRIIVEFEYSDRNYTRFLVTSSNTLITEKSKFWLNIYDESDNKNQAFEQELSPEDRFLLSEIGDNLNLALVPSYDSLQFDIGEIRYALKDTLVEGFIYDSIFVYSTNPDAAFYRVSFAFAGQNKGNYKKGVSAANGRVYQWVAPIDGIPQGDHIPYKQIITPKKTQMFSIGGESQITDKTKINFELAQSKNDINTFSKLDSDDDVGIAFRVGGEQVIFKSESRYIGALLNYDFLQNYFRGIENFRSPEFNRDWNLESYYSEQNENAISGGLIFTDKKIGRTFFNTSFLDRGSEYQGLQNSAKTDLKFGTFNISANAALLKSNTSLYYTGFLRHKITLSKDFKHFKIGLGENSESNLWRNNSNDSIVANSFRFNSYEAFVKTGDSISTDLALSYKYREDDLPKNNELMNATKAHDFSFGGGFGKNPNHRLNTLVTHRMLEVSDTSLYSGKTENNTTGRIEYNFRLLKGFVSSTSFYEIGSGLERKTEFSYIEVAPGQGIYTWTDYNSNGIQELDEFDLAHFVDQANFIRIIIPTAEYIKTYSNQINQSLNINPEVRWRNKTGIKKFVSRFSNQFAYRISQKNTSSDILEYANPFAKEIDDNSLVNMISSFRNSFSFNRGNPKFGADYIIQANNNKMLLVSGFDTRTNQLHILQFRYNISSKLGIQNKSGLGDKSYNSEFFSNKNFVISNNLNEIQINYQPNMNNRLSLKYNYKIKENNAGIEKLTVNDIGFDYRLSSVKKGSLNASFNLIHYDYNSVTNNPIAYEMLEGLLPGMNLTWAVSFQRQLSNGLQLNLTYNARKSSDTKIIHTGGVQMRAFF